MRMPPKSRKTPASNDESPLFALLLRERTEALCGCDPQPALLRDEDVTPPGVRRISRPYDGHLLRPGDPILRRIAASLVLPLDACACLESTYSKDSWGYTRVKYRGRKVHVHRLLFGYINGPVPLDQTIDHICGNPGCVTVAHMRLVPVTVNILSGRGPTAENARKERCPRCGGEFDSAYGKQGELGHRLCRRCVRAYDRARNRARSRARWSDPAYVWSQVLYWARRSENEPDNRYAVWKARAWLRRYARLTGISCQDVVAAAGRATG